MSCSCITSSVCLLLKVCHLVQIFQTKLSILLLFIVLLSDILVQEYMRAYDSQHALLACISLCLFSLCKALLMKIVPRHTPVPLPELPFLHTCLQHTYFLGFAASFRVQKYRKRGNHGEQHCTNYKKVYLCNRELVPSFGSDIIIVLPNQVIDSGQRIKQIPFM